MRLRRLGLDDTAPLALVRALRRDVPALWMPEALATLCSLVAATAGAKIDPADLLLDWGLTDPDEAAEADALRSIENLRRFAASRQSSPVTRPSDA